MADELKTVEAFRSVPMVARPELLTVTTIKKRHVEQLPEVGADIFPRLEVVGLCNGYLVIARDTSGGRLVKVTLNAWVDWLCEGQTALRGRDAYEMVNASYTQLFTD